MQTCAHSSGSIKKQLACLDIEEAFPLTHLEPNDKTPPMADSELERPSTPPNNNIPRAKIISTTPRSERTDAGSRAIPHLRSTIAEKMRNEFVTCSVEDFISHYMPFAPSEEHVNRFISSHRAVNGQQSDNCLFEEHDEKLVFTDDYIPPPLSQGTEKVMHEQMANIAEAIAAFEPPEGRQINFIYHSCPDTRIGGDIEGGTNRIDACLRWKSELNGKLHVSDIGVAIEYKLDKKLAVQNNRQLLSMNAHSANDDIRRMTIFGISIRADLVRIWFHSRSHSAVSAEFSFVENPFLFVQMMMAFMFAVPQELGYDPKVTRHALGVYTYEITNDGSSRYFRTVKPLSFYRSNNITGRMTRVWLVNEVDASGKHVTSPPVNLVLKDVWLDHRARTEKEIQADIFKDIEDFFSSRDDSKLQSLRDKFANIVRTGEYKKYFMNIVTDCTGETSKAIPDNSEPAKGDLLFDEQPNTPVGTTVITPGTRVSTAPGLMSATSIETSMPTPMRSFTPRRQYRVVFSEVCDTIADLKTLGQVVTALSSVLIPLQLLLGAGWVHRDISCGNIMVHTQGGDSQVKLADLEYAKKFPPVEGSIAADDPKTGTWCYMPTEIVQEKRIYVPPPPPMPVTEFYDTILKQEEETIPAELTSEPPIFHNFLHDLESVFWILVRVITARVNTPAARKLAKKLFKEKKRFDWFRNTDRTKDEGGIVKSLADALPEQLQAFPNVISRIRMILNHGFAIREAQMRELEHFDYSSEYAIVDKTLGVLLKGKEAWGDYPLLVHDFVYAQPSQPNGASKRARESGEYIPAEEGALNEGNEIDSDISAAEDSIPAQPRQRTAKRSRFERAEE